MSRHCSCPKDGTPYLPTQQYCPRCAALLAAARVRSSFPTSVQAAAAARAAPEKQLLAQVEKLARAHQYLFYHTFDARRSAPGFPDVILLRAASPWRPARLIVAELKSRRGKVSAAQAQWLAAFREIAGIECYVWTPSSLPDLEVFLDE